PIVASAVTHDPDPYHRNPRTTPVRARSTRTARGARGPHGDVPQRAAGGAARPRPRHARGIRRAALRAVAHAREDRGTRTAAQRARARGRGGSAEDLTPSRCAAGCGTPVGTEA